MDQKQFIVLWGPLQLVVSRGKVFRFLTRDLPADLQALLDGKQPMSDEAARGFLDSAEVAPPAPAVQPQVQPPPPQPAGSQESDAGQPRPPAPAPAISGAAAAPL